MVSPFFNLYLVEVGFSATLIGAILSIGALIELTVTPLLNRYADQHHAHRRLYIGYLLVFAIANFLFGNIQTTWILVLATLMVEASIRPSMTIGMQLTIVKLEQEGRAMIGRIRSFAALGFAFASLVAGQLFGIGGYPLIFWAGGFLTLVSVKTAQILPTKTTSDDLRSNPVPRRRGFYYLAASQFFVSMGIRAGHAFWWVHFQENLGVSTAHIGILVAFLAGAEVPFFMLLDPLMKRFNPRITFIVGSFGLSIIFLLLGAVPNVWWLIPLILIRGILWPMYHVPVFLVASKISHPRNVATNQAILQITVPAIAVLLTGTASGWIFDHLGAFPFFAATATACMIGGIIAVIGYRTMQPIAIEE